MDIKLVPTDSVTIPLSDYGQHKQSVYEWFLVIRVDWLMTDLLYDFLATRLD